MKDKRYFFSISLITVVILAIGAFFWSSGTVNIDENTVNLPEGTWHLGELNAPITIDTYPDFT